MLKIRLSRRGKKKQPSYRVVVADVNSKRDGRIVERIGHYNPLTEPAEFTIKEDRALHWLNVGAQPTDAVRRLLDKQGTFDRLGRMRAGESVEILAAEVSGVVVAAPEAVEEVVGAEETAEEETVVEKVVEAVKDVAADAVEKVEEAVEAVAETVEDVVDGDDDDEEAETEEEAADEATAEAADDEEEA
ncbi:30S ribosomal protein S16 [Candidatus Leptofilum sp.]|uniref:30S ribosomal protein S16 n=1 Tax=Candidatus Leptofilum sp. TaxID=3241576 RepID=UPI003B595461